MILNNHIHENLDISIIIPVKKGDPNLARSLAAIEKLKPQPKEVLLVAIGGMYAKDYPDKSFNGKVIEVAPNLTISAACNKGATQATGNISLFLSPDNAVQPKTLFYILKALRANKNCFALVGCIEKSLQYNFISQYQVIKNVFAHQKGTLLTDTFNHKCGAIYTHLFKKIGGFDGELLSPQIADIELGNRLKTNGYGIKRAKNVFMTLLEPITPKNYFSEVYKQVTADLYLAQKKKMTSDYLRKMITPAINVLTVLAIPIFMGMKALAPIGYWGIAACMLVLLGVNAPFYYQLFKKRRLPFATIAIVWHWLEQLFKTIFYVIGFVDVLREERHNS